MNRVQNFLRKQHLAGILLTRVNNFSWITAGIADNEIVITSEVGAASLLRVDHRVSDYFHHTPTDLQLRKYAIVNVCARRWGLVASVARFVHFGPLDPDLKRKLQAAMKISAEYQAHSKPGLVAAK